MSNTQTLHFRIGADAGILIMNIAHEHLIYDNDFEKAVSVFTESFGQECPEDLLMQLLTGDMIVLVDELDQMFQVVPRAEYPHLDNLYPKLNLVEYAEKLQKEFDNSCADLKEGLNNLVRKFDGKHYMSLDFSSEALIAYIYGNDTKLIDEVLNDYELNQWQLLIKFGYDFIKTSLKKVEVVRKLARNLKVDVEVDTYGLTEIQTALQKIACLDFEPMNLDTQADINVQNYLDATKEIDEVVSKGIEPVDIMDNWSAGWLSPEGDYYALNGEIANMLHIQIGEALQEQGIVPKLDKYGNKQNPDSWLEEHGWVKIHGDNVQFGGCLNDKLYPPKTNVHMTDIQKKMIYEYISLCHGGIVRLGWRMTKISSARFQMTDDLMLAKNYFNY